MMYTIEYSMFWFKENQRPHDYGDFYIIWHSEPGKLEQINQINQSKSMS